MNTKKWRITHCDSQGHGQLASLKPSSTVYKDHEVKAEFERHRQGQKCLRINDEPQDNTSTRKNYLCLFLITGTQLLISGKFC